MAASVEALHVLWVSWAAVRKDTVTINKVKDLDLDLRLGLCMLSVVAT